MDLPLDDPRLEGYDACFFCAGKSNIGMSRKEYYHLSYDKPIIEVRDINRIVHHK